MKQNNGLLAQVVRAMVNKFPKVPGSNPGQTTKCFYFGQLSEANHCES